MAPFRPEHVDRRTFLKTAAAGAWACSWPCGAADAASSGDTLYNGIRITNPWPPRRRGFQARPVTPPYLLDRPDVVPIDVGRQLFVDDFLIEETSLVRTFHRPVYHPANPVLRPTTRWEKYDEYAERTKTRSNPAAMVFSDGVFYDPQDRIFKMWYMGGYSQNTCYAFSRDGIEWEKPSLDVVPGTNITMAAHRDSSTIWLDLTERDPARRYKMAFWYDHYLVLHVAADGIHWKPAGRSGPAGDRSTFFYNPFRKVWVFSIRGATPGNIGGRFRRYLETTDFEQGARWQEHQPVPWVSSDIDDPRRPEYAVPAELYNLDCVAYESVLLGLFTIFRGERNEREKPNDVCVGFSRDGFHWDRPDRQAFLPVSERVGDWNWGNVQSAGGCCLVVGDTLHFYVSGRHGVPGTTEPGVCSTGLATLRRDGFVSMSDGDNSGDITRIEPPLPRGTLITRPVTFSGRFLFVNARISGELRVEVLDREGRTIAPFSADRCVPISGDGTRMAISWQGVPDLSAVAGRPVRFRFSLRSGEIYAFWVSPSASGVSRGYVAAGGPGFTNSADL